MTPEQITAFQAGSSAKPEQCQLLLLSLFCAALFLWAAWTLLSAYRAVANQQMSWSQLGGITARTFLIVFICFWLLLS